MEIIIIGCGKVGYTIAKHLSAEDGVNVTIVDHHANAFDKASESIDAMLVKGNGLNANTLLEAGVKDADLLISVTSADETNILCCISAKRLGVKHTIARIRNPEHAFELNDFWQGMGLDMIINPELETAREISRLLRYPSVDDIDFYFGGRVELVSFKIAEFQDFFVGKTVSQVFNSKTKTNMLLALIERGNAAIIPDGALTFEKNDVIKVLARPSDIMRFFALIGKSVGKVKNATIIGGSKITYYLVNLLRRHSIHTAIKVIEMDKAKCEALSESFPRCLVINGDGTDEDILSSEVADPSGAIICLTDRDEENTIIALYCQQLGVKKIILKINHINQKIVKNLGLGSIISPKNITSHLIIRYVRGLKDTGSSEIKSSYMVYDNDDDRIEAIEFHINKKLRCLNVPIRDLRIKKGILICCIDRNGNAIIPTGESCMQQGDSVMVIAKGGSILALDDILMN